jgi:acyl-CoA synthetase (NDP forming)
VVGDQRAPRDLELLFDPRSIAVLGASATPGKWGNWLARGALKGAGRRQVFLVSRGSKEVLGVPTYPSLAGIGQPVDLVVISIGPDGFEQAVEDALRAGARAIVAITAGLGELGASGLAIERAAVERVRAAGAVLVGPNCLGVSDTATDLDLAFQEFNAGPIGLISQSGNLALELAMIAAEAGVGFSRFVSVGNQADVEVTDLIRMFAGHDATRVIAVYDEDFRDGRAFAQAAQQAAEAGKPVIVLTVGSSRAGARAARSHTGALVSASVAIDAACRAGGMLRVATPRQMIELAQGLLMPDMPHGRRVGVIGDGGGHVALAADLLAEQGLELPFLTDALSSRLAAFLPPTAATRNPVDLAGGGEQDFHNYALSVEMLAESAEVDAVVLTGYFGGYSQESEDFQRVETEVAESMAGAVRASERPLIVHTMYPAAPPSHALRARGVPVYSDIATAARVLGRLVDRAERRPSGVPTLPKSKEHPRALEGYFEARDLLAAAGIAFARALRVTTATEARAVARELGFPVVLKALGTMHKSDVGAVRLRIASDEDLKAAFAEMASRLEPSAFSVESMAQMDGAVELLVGVRRDASFGPILVVGVGGLYAELLNDVAVALAPVSEELAEELIRSLRAAPLLAGARGRMALDIEAAARAAAALSRVAAEHPDIAEVEINPLLVGRDGAIGLDARLVLGRAQLT